MTASDIVICQFRFTGTSSNDQFFCSDYYSQQDGMPDLDSQDNIDDISTQATFSTSGSTKLVTLTATFDRLLDTSQADDARLRQGGTSDAIWAHGYILGSNTEEHGQTSTDRGAYRMFIPSFTYQNALAGVSLKFILSLSVLIMSVLF